MIYGYARVSTDGQSVAGAGRGVEETRGGQGVPRNGERSQDQSGSASPLGRQARSWRRVDGDEARTPGPIHRRPVEHLAAITEKKAGFRSLGDSWADTTTAHGRLMLAVLGGLAEFERDLIRTRTGGG